MIITVTEREEFKRCRRRWFFGSPNGLKLQRITPSPALALGDLIHKTLAEWLVNEDTDCSEKFMYFAADAVENARQTYKKQIGAFPSNEELAGFLDSVELGQAMMRNYQAYWKRPLPDGSTLIAPEQKVEIPIPDSHHFLEARLDGAVSSPKGNLYVLEHKTYGNRPRQETLDANDQFLAYIWALSQLQLGPVAGLAYDGMWKRKAPPKGSTIDDLFTRTFLIRPQDELDEFVFFLQAEASEMDFCATAGHTYGPKNGILYINRRWEGCFDCGFDPLCRALSRGEDYDYLKNSLYTVKEVDGSDAEV